jgi:hypothetical protein
VPAELIGDVKGGDTPTYVRAVKYLKEMKDERILLKKADYESLRSKFIIPLSLHKEIMSDKLPVFDAALRRLDALAGASALLAEKDVINLSKERPLLLAYLAEKEKAFGKQYAGESAKILSHNWLRRFASGKDYMKEYEALSGYLRNGVEVELFPEIDLIDGEFSITLEYLKPNIVFDENNSYGETTILKKLQDYTKALKSALVKWDHLDRAIIAELRQKVQGMGRSIERIVEQTNSRNFILGMLSEVVRGTLDDSSFSRICFDIYVRYQFRIDGVIDEYRKETYPGGRQ